MAREKKDIKILIIDDEKVIRDFLVGLLYLEGVPAEAAESGLEAIGIVKNKKFNIVFVDMGMPKMNGTETLRELQKISPESRYVMMTGFSAGAVLDETAKLGAYSALEKPFEISAVMGIIENYLLNQPPER